MYSVLSSTNATTGHTGMPFTVGSQPFLGTFKSSLSSLVPFLYCSVVVFLYPVLFSTSLYTLFQGVPLKVGMYFSPIVLYGLISIHVNTLVEVLGYNRKWPEILLRNHLHN